MTNAKQKKVILSQKISKNLSLLPLEIQYLKKHLKTVKMH